MKILRIACLMLMLLSTTSTLAADKVVVIPLGSSKPDMNWSGDWAVDNVYKVGDVIRIDGSSYMCVTNHTSSVSEYPFDSAYWELIAAAGETGPQGIPGVDAMELKNLVTVSATGGDFTDPVAALDSITDASANNPYMVFIGPGVYTVSQTLVMKPYVSISGSGQNATKITGSIGGDTASSSAAIITGADNTSLANLTIENINNGVGANSIGIFNNNNSPLIQNITVKCSVGTGSYPNIYGMYNDTSSATLKNITVSMNGNGAISYGLYNSNVPYADMTGINVTFSGSYNVWGIRNNNSSSPTISDVKIDASGLYARGIQNENSTPIITNAQIKVNGPGTAYGIDNIAASSPILTNIYIDISGNAYSPCSGIHNDSSTADIKNTITEINTNGDCHGTSNNSSTVNISRSTLKGFANGNGIYISGSGVTHVMQSSIINGVAFDSSSTATITCVNSDNGVDTALNNSCQ